MEDSTKYLMIKLLITIPIVVLLILTLDSLSWVFLLLAALCYLLRMITMSNRLKRLLTYYGHKRRFKVVFLSLMTEKLFGLSVRNPTWEKKGLDPYTIWGAIETAEEYDIKQKYLLGLVEIICIFSALRTIFYGVGSLGAVGFCIALSIIAPTILAVETLVDLIAIRNLKAMNNEGETLLEHYNAINGDIDEKAYNSDWCVQKFWQRRRTNIIKEMLKPHPGSTTLDIGCGSGVQLRSLENTKPGLLIGTDLSLNALSYAKKKSMPGSEFILADAQYLPFKRGAVDRVICAEIIEHLNTPGKMVSEIKRVLMPLGLVVITTPNENSIWGIYEFFWDKLGRGRNYGETHLKFFTIKELKAFFPGYTTATQTLYVLAPLFALLNSKRLLNLGRKIDALLEKRDWGVIIVIQIKKEL